MGTAPSSNKASKPLQGCMLVQQQSYHINLDYICWLTNTNPEYILHLLVAGNGTTIIHSEDKTTAYHLTLENLEITVETYQKELETETERLFLSFSEMSFGETVRQLTFAYESQGIQIQWSTMGEDRGIKYVDVCAYMQQKIKHFANIHAEESEIWEMLSVPFQTILISHPCSSSRLLLSVFSKKEDEFDVILGSFTLCSSGQGKLIK